MLQGMGISAEHLQEAAKRHLWMHFTRLGDYADSEVPVIVRGEGPWVWDANGKRYLDGLSGLFVVQAGYGRRELVEAGAKQAADLAYFPLWSYGHPAGIELAERLSELAPGDVNRVFFTTGGSEAVETAWKLARQYFKAIGQPGRTKAISRRTSYHGVSMGALSITGYEAIKTPFEPLVPGTSTVPNTEFYHAPVHGDDAVAFGLWAADQIAERIEAEGPETVAAVFLEPVQNAGGCLLPPPGYFRRVPDMRPLRRAPRLGRGHMRLWAPRLLVRGAALRVSAGHDHAGQGHELGLLAHRGVTGPRPVGRTVPARSR